VARQERGDQGQQATQVRREVDVHVTDDLRVTARPRGAQRMTAALALEAQERDRGQLAREGGADLGGAVGARVVGDEDPPGEGELGAQEAVEAADAERQRGLLLVHGHHDLHLRTRGGPRGGRA
jgi:hypothetical protein